MIEKIKSLPVEEFTSPSPFTAQRSTPYQEVVELMRKNGFRHVPVLENKSVVGIISERDLKLPSDGAPIVDLTAGEIMSADPYTVNVNTSLEEVAFTLSTKKIGSAIVEDNDGVFTGIFTSTDALNALVEVLRGDFS